MRGLLLALALLSGSSAFAHDDDCETLTRGNRIIYDPGCYQLGNTLIDPIAIMADEVTLDLRGHAIACRSGRGYAVAVIASRNVTIKNGTIGNRCDWGVDAYSWGASDGLRLEGLRVENAAVRGIQANGARITVRDVLVRDVGPASPGYCLTIGVEVRGDDATMRNVTVLDTVSAGGLDRRGTPCEAVSVSFTEGRRGLGDTVTVNNEHPQPEAIGVWIGGGQDVTLIRPDITGVARSVLSSSTSSVDMVAGTTE